MCPQAAGIDLNLGDKKIRDLIVTDQSNVPKIEESFY
jgi:hypothetical protein